MAIARARLGRDGRPLRSSDGPDATVISGKGLEESVVTCVSGKTTDTIIEGLTIADGMGHKTGNLASGGGVRIVDSGLTLIDCVLENNNTATFGTAIRMRNNEP